MEEYTNFSLTSVAEGIVACVLKSRREAARSENGRCSFRHKDIEIVALPHGVRRWCLHSAYRLTVRVRDALPSHAQGRCGLVGVSQNLRRSGTLGAQLARCSWAPPRFRRICIATPRPNFSSSRHCAMPTTIDVAFYSIALRLQTPRWIASILSAEVQAQRQDRCVGRIWWLVSR